MSRFSLFFESKIDKFSKKKKKSLFLLQQEYYFYYNGEEKDRLEVNFISLILCGGTPNTAA